MKKKVLILEVLAITALMVLVVNAHPGRTDSAGGHTDHSTGEYHYHHGYSAHSHYDMDGDGKVDCPYDFKDKTNHSSNNSSTKDTTNKSEKSSKSDIDVGTVITICIAVVLVGFWIAPAFFRK